MNYQLIKDARDFRQERFAIDRPINGGTFATDADNPMDGFVDFIIHPDDPYSCRMNVHLYIRDEDEKINYKFTIVLNSVQMEQLGAFLFANGTDY